MQIAEHFDPHERNGAGAWGHLATTDAGISRFAATPEEAARKAQLAENAYRHAGRLDEVRANLGL